MNPEEEGETDSIAQFYHSSTFFNAVIHPGEEKFFSLLFSAAAIYKAKIQGVLCGHRL